MRLPQDQHMITARSFFARSTPSASSKDLKALSVKRTISVQLFQGHGLLLGCGRRILYLMFLEVCILRLYVFGLLLLVDLLALPKKALGFDFEAAFAHGHGGV